MKSIEWHKNSLAIIDQTRLPKRLHYQKLKNGADVVTAIKKLKVRGAPLIGVAAAYGVALEARRLRTAPRLRAQLYKTIDNLLSARPTAVNLGWALARLKKLIDDPAVDTNQLPAVLAREASKIEKEETDACDAIGRFGAELINDGDRIMTYCNAGRLATPGIGTALGILYTAQAQGKKISVYACETRPLLQGGRLTAFELKASKIPVTVIADNMVAAVMHEVDKVIVGADRIAGNGDTANKIGTLTVAITAFHYHVPFYVAAPVSSIDPTKKTGNDIPIEYRDRSEIATFGTVPLVPAGVKIFNPAFDVTPASLISAIVTDRGVARPPGEEAINRLLKI
jgi:methylthioribose-1-phosphate isomerase